MRAHWLTRGAPPWRDLEDVKCLVCGQIYKMHTERKPAHWWGAETQTWPPGGGTTRWSVNVFGANGGYALCTTCQGPGRGKTEIRYVTGEPPLNFHPVERRLQSNLCLWNSSEGYWVERDLGSWDGSRSRGCGPKVAD